MTTRIKNPRFPHTCKIYRVVTTKARVSDDPNMDEDNTEQTTEKVLYEGKCRSYDHDSTSDKGEVITQVRDLALPVRQDEWTEDNVPKKGDFVEVNKGAFKEWGTVIDPRPNNLGTDILFRYNS
jgi:transcription antitermination factor NusG